MHKIARVIATFLAALIIAACAGAETPQPAPSPSPSSEPVQEPSPSPEPSPTPTPLPTAAPTEAPGEGYQTPGDYFVGMEAGGMERRFIIHVPPGYQPGTPAPLVVNLHGYSGTASDQQRLSYMDAKADEEGFVVVYPQAANNPPAWLGPLPGPEGWADMTFFRAMIAFLQREMSIDPARIYATGMSNGATMTNHLGCAMSDTFAAIAPVSGGQIAFEQCKAGRPVSVLVFHGTEDSVIPYEGTESGTPPVHAWVEAWAERDGCDPAPSISHPYPDVQTETWQNCSEGAEVTLYTIEGGRHDWPGSGFGPGPYPAGMAPDIYATDLIWEFFEAHPMPAGAVRSSPTTPMPEKRYQTPGDYIGLLDVDGVERWFTVHIPPGYEPGTLTPLVVNLHPYSATAFEQDEWSQMNAKADKEGFIVVNPQALNDPPSWYGPLPGEAGQLDRDFFEELLTYLQREMSVDPARIYATGLSNGATMSYRLGCDMSDIFAAIAPVSGGHVAHHLCQIESPISVLVIHGTEDWVIPYYGNGTDSPPVQTWMEAWAEHNGCDPTPSVDHPFASTKRETWGNCERGVEVVLITLEGGGHTWPGAPPEITSGISFPYMNATDVIWDFFQSHPKEAAPEAAGR